MRWRSPLCRNTSNATCKRASMAMGIFKCKGMVNAGRSLYLWGCPGKKALTATPGDRESTDQTQMFSRQCPHCIPVCSGFQIWARSASANVRLVANTHAPPPADDKQQNTLQQQQTHTRTHTHTKRTNRATKRSSECRLASPLQKLAHTHAHAHTPTPTPTPTPTHTHPHTTQTIHTRMRIERTEHHSGCLCVDLPRQAGTPQMVSFL